MDITIPTRWRKARTALAAVLLAAGLGLVAPAGASASTAAAVPVSGLSWHNCGIVWGSLPRSNATNLGPSQDPITNIRAGRHACFDRLVVDVRGEAPRYTVRYVPEVVQDGSGAVVPLRGGAFLQVTVLAPAHDSDYNATYSPANPKEAVNVAGFATFRQVAFLGTFEAVTQIGLGVRARLPFRVFTLDGPGDGSRLVVDVAHRW
ncbi:AMIN-like domain-containing (lipo)protein [Arthrobacter sp. 35W]|uniref:AMIN-like domain-containing (lipo)protein n=1 Tax=Arthrobacter sp. 35W TaxID=1132441 RepID=UPI00041EC70D|nr:hypothetical protein [Arthrobacter sp. 35W]